MGMIQGGWAYIWTAYGVSALVFVGYSWSVWSRLRAERRQA